MKVEMKNVGNLCNIQGLPIVSCSTDFVLNDLRPRAFMIINVDPSKNKYLLRTRHHAGEFITFEVDPELVIDIA